MAGPSQRNLTLTEELEKLEQSITLTLQEIDSNFSRAHRIVTTSILPIVEQYAEHSKDVWEGAKFWKQFFEASANVSLSGYEEQPNEDTEQEEQTVTEESSNTTHTMLDEAVSYETPSSEHLDLDHRGDDLDLSSLTISPSHSTPRPPVREKAHRAEPVDQTPSSVSYPSPYEALRRENDPSALPDDTPVTPGRSSGRHRGAASETPLSSPFVPPASHSKPSTAKKNHGNQRPTDPVLHRVLDKTYRVQATPLSKGFNRPKFAMTPKDKSTGSRYAFDDSPLSSPEMEAPQLHAEIFSSPVKGGAATPGTSHKQRRRRRSSNKNRATPKPGISVLTPGKPKSARKGGAGWDSDDDDDYDAYDDLEDSDAFGVSPPKTMQFHIPHSRLMKTPAKEASKRIVSDLLATAGGDGEDLSDEYGYDPREEHSPTVVRRGGDLGDDTF